MKRETVVAGSTFALIPLTILALSTLCTWLVAHGASPFLRLPFKFICHGIERRCLTIWNTPMPICARCTAIYLGLFAGLAVFFVLPWLHEKAARWLMYAAAIPMAIDGVTQALQLRESTNSLRVMTGSLAGFAFGYWILSAIERRDERVAATRKDVDPSS